MKIFFALLLIINSHEINAECLNNTPNFLSIITNYPESQNWIQLPKKGILQLTVKTKNAEVIKFWLVPAGSNTWQFRKLIKEEKIRNDTTILEWQFNQEIHSHIVIQIKNRAGCLNSQSLNITNV